MTKTLVIYKGKSDFDSVNTMVSDLGYGFVRLGWDVNVMDLRTPDCVSKTASLVRGQGVDLFLSVNGYGVPGADSTSIGFYAESAAPVLIYFVDHPIYHHTTIRAPLPSLRVTFPTAHHLDFCRAHIRNDIPMRHVGHGAAPARPNLVKDWSERDVAVFVPSSLGILPEDQRAQWGEQYGPQVAARLHCVVEAHEDDPARPLHLCVEEVVGSVSLTLMHAYCTVADSYLRARVKLSCARAMVQAGLQPVICGPGWPDLGGGAVQMGAQPVQTAFEFMGRSRLVLNLLPPYYESHERPLQAALHGAVAASSPSPWLDGVLGGNMLSLSTSPVEAAAQLGAALADGDGLAACAAQGRAAVEAGHLWAHRAAELAEFAAP